MKKTLTLLNIRKSEFRSNRCAPERYLASLDEDALRAILVFIWLSPLTNLPTIESNSTLLTKLHQRTTIADRVASV